MAYVLPNWLILMIIGIVVLIAMIMLVTGWTPGVSESISELVRFGR
jgi:hypothetical protein